MEALDVVVLGRAVAPPLLGEDVDHDGTVVLGRVPKGLLHARDVVAVEGAHVAHAQGGEEVPGLEHLPQRGPYALEAGLGQAAHRGQLPQELLQPRPRRHVRRVEPQPGQALREA